MTRLVTELGPIVASFDFGEPIPIENIRANLGSGTSSMDERLGCLRLEDTRHDLELLIWPRQDSAERSSPEHGCYVCSSLEI